MLELTDQGVVLKYGEEGGRGAGTWEEVVVHGAGWDELGHDAGLWHEAPCSADPDGGDLHGEGEV